MGGTSCDVSVLVGGARRWAAAARSAAGRWRCRWWTSTPSAPAAARSPGATRAARCASGPRSAGADPGPACYGRGGESRLSPMPTSCSATSTPIRRSRAACPSTARRPSAGRRAGDELGLVARDDGRGIVARGQCGDGAGGPRRDGRARHRSARARARGLRRGGSAACGADRRGAGDAAVVAPSRPASSPPSGWWSPSVAGTLSRACSSRATT